MLSGIGPAKHLKHKSIQVIRDLPVGENLQDHLSFPGVVFSMPDKTTEIPPSKLTNILGFINTKNDSRYPNIELLSLIIPKNQVDDNDKTYVANFWGMSKATSDVYRDLGAKSDILLIAPIMIRPKSRGKVLLINNDYKSHPIIMANYTSDVDDEDLNALLGGIASLVAMNNTEVFQSSNIVLERINHPGCSQYAFPSRDYWVCAIGQVAGTLWHPAGTNKMGPVDDATSVVDSTLKVKGISGLRVIDASIMPLIPSSHINAPTIMIAEKGADIIKQEYNIIE